LVYRRASRTLNVAPKDFAGRDQRTFYHRGVGTNRREKYPWRCVRFWPVTQCRDTYRFLVQAFEPGDELFSSGSAGAHSPRAAPWASSATAGHPMRWASCTSPGRVSTDCSGRSFETFVSPTTPRVRRLKCARATLAAHIRAARPGHVP
jgi:hypothetical protein